MTQSLVQNIAEYLEVKESIAKKYLDVLLNASSADGGYFEFDPNITYLQNVYLITSYVNRTHETIYFPVDPSFSFPALLLKKMWDVDNELYTFDDLLVNPSYPELKQKYYQCEKIVSELLPHYSRIQPFLESEIAIVEGKEKIASYIANLISESAEEIKAVVSPPYLLGTVVWQAVTNKMAKGLKYKRVSVFSELPLHGYKIYEKEVNDYSEELFIYKNNALDQKFYIINDIIVIFFKRDKANGEFSAQVINNHGMVAPYSQNFERYMSNSTNLLEMLPALKKFRQTQVMKANKVLSQDELSWFKEVFDYGTYANFDGMSNVTCESAKRICFENGFIEEVNGNVLAKYTMEDI
jgi:hypothetical protein